MTNERSNQNGNLESFAVLALVVTFLLRYAPFLASRLLFAPVLDNVYIYGPMFSEVSRLSLSGTVPYYLPDIGTGFPVFESPHFSILYPFYFFGLLNYGGPLASLYTLTNLTLLHIFIFYVEPLCLVAVRYNYALGVVHWRIRWDAGAKHRTLRKLDRYHSQLCLATVSACRRRATLAISWEGLWNTRVFHCGRPSGIGERLTAGNSRALMCLILFAAGVIWMCLERRFTDIWRLAWSLVVCTSIAFGLAGAATLPMYIATGEMIRFVALNAWVIGHAHIPWEIFNLWQLPLSQAIGIVIKPTWTATLGSPYIGPLGLIGTLLAAIYFRRLNLFLRMLVVAFGIISMYGLLSAFGTNLGLAYVNFHLPFINRIREAGRHLVLFVIGVSFLSGVGYSLAARGLEALQKRRRCSPAYCSSGAMTIFAGIILSELLRSGDGQRWSGFWILASAPILVVLGSSLSLALLPCYLRRFTCFIGWNGDSGKRIFSFGVSAFTGRVLTRLSIYLVTELSRASRIRSMLSITG